MAATRRGNGCNLCWAIPSPPGRSTPSTIPGTSSLRHLVLAARQHVAARFANAVSSCLCASVGNPRESAWDAHFIRRTGLLWPACRRVDPYTPLMQYLHSVDSVRPMWALKTQDFLWQCYAKREFLVGCGISAMPSMHVATSFSFVLLAFATNRLLGAVMSVLLRSHPDRLRSTRLALRFGRIYCHHRHLVHLAVGGLVPQSDQDQGMAGHRALGQPVSCNAASRSQNEAGPPP